MRRPTVTFDAGEEGIKKLDELVRIFSAMSEEDRMQLGFRRYCAVNRSGAIKAAIRLATTALENKFGIAVRRKSDDDDPEMVFTAPEDEGTSALLRQGSTTGGDDSDVLLVKVPKRTRKKLSKRKGK
jgi:hypothetical protein